MYILITLLHFPYTIAFIHVLCFYPDNARSIIQPAIPMNVKAALSSYLASFGSDLKLQGQDQVHWYQNWVYSLMLNTTHIRACEQHAP